MCDKLIPHKHAELIKAWAEGHQIQYHSKNNNRWNDATSPEWCLTTEYRIKPKKQTWWFNVYSNVGDNSPSTGAAYLTKEEALKATVGISQRYIGTYSMEIEV